MTKRTVKMGNKIRSAKTWAFSNEISVSKDMITITDFDSSNQIRRRSE